MADSNLHFSVKADSNSARQDAQICAIIGLMQTLMRDFRAHRYRMKFEDIANVHNLIVGIEEEFEAPVHGNNALSLTLAQFRVYAKYAMCGKN